MKIFFVTIAILISASVWANDEKKITDKLFICLDKHKVNVAKNIISLEEGAMLITETLCSNESTNLANFMAANREDISRPNYIARYHNEIYIIRRDVRWLLYQEKLKR